MTKFDRLEDITPAWRTYFSGKLAGAEEEAVRRGVEAVLPDRVDVGDPGQVDRITQALSDARRRRVRESVMPACLGWLREKGYWGQGESRETRAINEIAGALDSLMPFTPKLPAPVATIKNYSWAIPSAAGAVIGAVALAPLTLLLFNSREIGLFLGGVLGAAGLVGAGRRPGLQAGHRGRIGNRAEVVRISRGADRDVAGPSRPAPRLAPRRRIHAGILVAAGDRPAPGRATVAGRGARGAG